MREGSDGNAAVSSVKMGNSGLPAEETGLSEPAVYRRRASDRISGELKRLYDSQLIDVDPLLNCLDFMCRYYGVALTEEDLTAGLPVVDNKLTPSLFIRAAEQHEFSSQLLRKPLLKLNKHLFPVVLLLRENHACVLMDVQGEIAHVVLAELKQGVTKIPLAELESLYLGRCLLLKPSYRYDAERKNFIPETTGHWFWSCLRRDRFIFSEVLLASLMINLFALASPLFVMNVYDRIVPNNSLDSLWVLATGMAVVITFDLFLRSIRSYFLDSSAKRADNILSAHIYQRVLSVETKSRPKQAGAMANHLHEFDSLREFITSNAMTLIVDLPFTLIFLLIIGQVGGPLVWVPATVFCVVVLCMYFIKRAAQGPIDDLQQVTSQKQAKLIETLLCAETIKSYRAEGMFQQGWERIIRAISQKSYRVRMLANLSTTLCSTAQQLSTVAVVVGGVYLIGAGELTMGGLIACSLLSSRSLMPVGQLSGMMGRMTQFKRSLLMLDDIMARPCEDDVDTPYFNKSTIEGNIAFGEVDFSYPDAPLKALDKVSLEIKAGERLAILGRVGSGKSTLEKLIMRFYLAEQGRVTIDGIDIAKLHPATLRKHIGYIPQEISLVSGTVRDNIIIGAPLAEDEEMYRAAVLAGLQPFIEEHPHGFNAQVGEGGRNLSGGQRQMIAIARALLLDPPILLMDEPTHSMDSSTEKYFTRVISELVKKQGKTLILITHKASLLTLVDRVLLMEQGRIVTDSAKEAFLAAVGNGQSAIDAGREH
ncbi:type I secretion system permease/ATPase [Sinobacterium caligoides]|uniref:type I secretion system permease/ATPase n=1 Tax=Sinobacterium caligoides TaxID=933926 RepID=UPI0013C36521|nr:type I secretion system permease/ATPase [Sinobacterium caligoides]